MRLSLGCAIRALASPPSEVKIKIGDNIDIAMGAINRTDGEIIFKKKTFNIAIGNSFLSSQLIGATMGSDKFFFKKRATKILHELKVSPPKGNLDLALKISIPPAI